MTPAKRVLLGRWIRPALLAVDCLLFNLFFWITLLIYPKALSIGYDRWVMWLAVNASLIPVLVYVGRVQRTYFRTILLDRALRVTLIGVGLHALFFLSIISLFDIEGLKTYEYLTYYGLMIVVETVWTILSRLLIKNYRRRGFNFIRVVIVGSNDTAQRLYKEMLVDSGYGYKMLAFFDYNPGNQTGHPPCIDISELEGFVKKNAVDQIYFAIPGHDDTMAQVMKIADDNVAEFFYVPMISPYAARNFHGDSIGAVSVMAVRANPLKNRVNRLTKRVFDIIFSGTFLLFYPLIYAIVGIAIRVTMPGPIYFKQQRTGYKGKPFVCLKFRSMNLNDKADEKQATLGDPRITKLGNFLRRSSIDELPQFINVFKGDMSIVGPRPHMLKHTEEYAKLIDKYMVRHLVKPGITGWAQINGYRGQTDELWKMEKRVESDVWYIENWTFLLDLKIIVRTFINVFQRDENAR